MHVRFDLLRHRACLAGITGLLVAAPAASAADPVFTEFAGGVDAGTLGQRRARRPRVRPGREPVGGRDGAPGRIAKVTPAGIVTEFTGGVTPNLRAGHMFTGANRWSRRQSLVRGLHERRRGREDHAGGAVTEYPRNLRAGSYTTAIAAGPDGNVWFTERPGRGGSPRSPRRRHDDVASGGHSPGFSADAQPRAITLGPDGNLWFTNSASPGRIGRITPGGCRDGVPDRRPPGPFAVDRQPVGIAAGPDGNLWFTERAGGSGGSRPPAS